MFKFAENYSLIVDEFIMKQTGFIIFFSIVLSLYALINFYIVRRGLQALPAGDWPRSLFLWGMLLLILAYPAGRILERFFPSGLTDGLVQTGAYYLAVMVTAFFVVLLVDLLRLLLHWGPLVPAAWRGYHTPVSLRLFLAVAGFVVLVTIAGAVNACYPRVRTLNLTIAKASPLTRLRIAFASDLHLGTLIHNARMKRMVKMINDQQPDVILLGGDLFDEDVASLSRQNMAAVLQQLQAPHGVYAIPGNHEYISGIEQSLAYMRAGGITVLRDQVHKVADAYYLIGRDDRQSRSMGSGRQRLVDLRALIVEELPVIVLDHQPFHLEEAEEAGVDLQLSGHTHHGQLFPFHLITRNIYEVSWGYKRKGDLHVYVSSGAGTWGPPVRTNSRPEIVVIDVRFAAPETSPGQ